MSCPICGLDHADTDGDRCPPNMTVDGQTSLLGVANTDGDEIATDPTLTRRQETPR